MAQIVIRGNTVVATQFGDSESCRRFLIRPNCSLPWRGVVRFYCGMLIVSFGIAIAFALMGAWLILPFAGLEMLVLGIALYTVARRNTRWQSISIKRDSVDIVQETLGCQQRQSFQRAWAQVVHQRAYIKGHPSRLYIRSHGRTVEVGACLNESEKKSLAYELKQVMRPSY